MEGEEEREKGGSGVTEPVLILRQNTGLQQNTAEYSKENFPMAQLL